MVCRLKGFEHVVERTHLHRFDGGRDRPLPGHDDADEVRIDFQRLAEQLDAVHPRHHQVAQEQVEILLRQRLEPLRAAGRSHRLIALVGQRLAQGVLQLDLIVHDEQAAPLRCGHDSLLPVPLSLGHSADPRRGGDSRWRHS